MKSAQEYKDSIREMNPLVYAYGKKVENVVDHPCFIPTLNSVALTYQMSRETENENIMTATSPFTGKRISRFLHICKSAEDLVKRAQLSKFLTPFHGACIGARCAGTAALNALYAITFDMDKQLGTDYHERFLKYLEYVQTEDLTCSGMVTDAKGDRSLSPSQQPDPDVYLHVKEVREDGIIVRGAKAHQSGAAVAHEFIVAPTTSMKESEKKFSVAFAIPSNHPGIIHIAESPAGNDRRFSADEMDFGNYNYGVHGCTLVVFDDVFIPKDRVFMCGEYNFSGTAAATFGNFQRLATSACKSGHCDLTCGAAAVASEFNGCDKMSHIRDKIIEMSYQSALAFGASIAAGYLGSSSESGVYFPDSLLVNSAKIQAVDAVWKASQLATEITGGIVCTAPSQRDFNSEIASYMEKYYKGRVDVSTEDRVRIARLVEYLVGQGSVIPTESTVGAGPSATQRLAIRQSNNLKYLKGRAKHIAGIKSK